MSEFTIRSESVDVEQIMKQIRGRIAEKRGVDYTEQQIREMATAKLEKFLDPRGVRSDLLERFRNAQPIYTPPELPNFAFEEQTLYESHRGPLRAIRRLLNPLLKLFFNPGPLIQSLNIQSKLNTMSAEREARREAARHGMDQLYYEVMHNLVVETTRMAIEVKNLKMKVESLTSRLEFNERRARALESVVVYKPLDKAAEADIAPQLAELHGDTRSDASAPAPPAQGRQNQQNRVERSGEPAGVDGTQAAAGGTGAVAGAEGPGQRSRRRRRRRGRRGGGSAAALMAGAGTEGAAAETGLEPGADGGDEFTDEPAEGETAEVNEAGRGAGAGDSQHVIDAGEHHVSADVPPTTPPEQHASIPAGEATADAPHAAASVDGPAVVSHPPEAVPGSGSDRQ